MCTVLFEFLVQLTAEALCLVPAAFGVYAVQNIVLVEALEKGVACRVALFAVRS
jgi:hypothetical protein